MLELSPKQVQFNSAMLRYRTLRRYRAFNLFVSVSNVSLQLYLLYRVWQHPIGAAWQLAALVAAFILTDFINGLVHMLMDNNDSYDSIFGPFIANFHMHHKVVQYRKRNVAAVYFYESGSKVWLVGYLFLVFLSAGALEAHPVVLPLLVYFGILSSVAEVSHYLCHNSPSKLVILLGNLRILLPKRHHARHHLEDNKNYAFLNGVTDPILNRLAKIVFKGYKQTTDTHYAHYVVQNAEER